MEAILITDISGGVGFKNDLLFWISEDLKRFKSITTDKNLLMGKNTWFSLPKKLPNRKHIVLSESLYDNRDLALHKDEMPDLFLKNKSIIDKRDDLLSSILVGGAQMYETFIPICDKVHLTLVKASREHDCKINLENLFNDFTLTECQSFTSLDKKSNSQVHYDFITLEK